MFRKSDRIMGYFGALVFVLQILRFTKAELKLDILQNFNGTKVPISNVLQATVGANLTLTCKLVTNSAANTFDNEVSWGWNRANVRFENVTDLQELALNSSNPLLQFLNKSDLNQATIAFHSLSQSDSGKYFCMSLKHELFNIVEIRVNGAGSEDSRKYNAHFRSKRFNEKGSVLVPKSFCNHDMFICNPRTSCVKYEYVCDSVIDCKDGSDENEHVCGSSPCEGKTNCSNGRCISPALCCDYNKNVTCMSVPGPSCCSEIIRGNKATYITSNNINTVGLKDDGWTYRRGFEGGEYNNWNEFNNPALRNSHGLVTKNSVIHSPKPNGSTTNTNRALRKTRKFLWILLSPIIVIVTVIGTLAKMWTDKCQHVSSNTENVNSSFGANHQTCEYGTESVASENNDSNLDLPPSYEEATRNR